jgi:hypothetical protein
MAIPRLAITSWVIRRREIYAASLSILLSLSTGLAQERPATVSNPSAITITASATANQVRFAAPSSVVQLRLEVYDSSGRKLFDNELRGGNVLDWHLLNGQAEQLADDTYLCVVTIKSLSGKITQRIGSVKIDQRTAKLQATTTGQMTAHQLEAIGPVEENAILTILEPDPQQTTTLVAHNGEDGQITRGRGALSFRLGDFYSGKDSEQMRLTQEGNLGIGISQPQARLDVDGFVRATQGIVFPDGSIQFSASRKTFGPPSQRRGLFQQTSATGQEHLLPDIGGTGTTGKIPKWIDGPNGVLGDSLITEANNNIGINTTPDPRFKLDVLGFNRFRAPNASFYLSGFKPGGNDWVYQTVDDDGRFRIWGGTNTTGAERLTIKLDTGNIGIGTSDPQSKLEALSFVSNTYGITHTDAQFGVTLGTFTSGPPTPTTGGWFGTRSNHPLSLFVNGCCIPRLTVATSGNVGIGTTNPFTRLEVVQPAATQLRFGASGADNGGYLISTLPSQAILAGGARWNGTNWIARDNVASLTATQFGHIEFYTDSGFNVGDTFNPTLRMKIDENGNVIQNRDRGGLVKAMVYVAADGSILRCYNGVSGSSSGNCGFSVTHFANGGYGINFGFQVDDRFVSVTPRYFNNFGVLVIPIAAFFFNSSTSTSVDVRTSVDINLESTEDAPFMIFVY